MILTRRTVTRIAQRMLLAPAAVAEQALLARSWDCDAPQLFILGLPRAGTTLIYQYLVHRLRCAYFTNGVGAMFRSPCLATWWQSRHGEYRSDFDSRFGKVTGPLAPREAGAVWGRFFPVDDRVEPGDLDEAVVRELRNTVHCVQRVFGGVPFVNKNVKHLLRMRALAEMFPEAQFLVVTRRPDAVAASLLRARTELCGSPDAWWSIRPRDHEALSALEPRAQVEGQVRSLLEELDDESSRIASDRVLRVAYEDFCERPEALVESVRAMIGPVDWRNEPRASFAPRSSGAPVQAVPS